MRTRAGGAISVPRRRAPTAAGRSLARGRNCRRRLAPTCRRRGEDAGTSRAPRAGSRMSHLSTHLEENLRALAARHPRLAAEIAAAAPLASPPEPTPAGDPTLTVDGVVLHSRHDPRREAARWAEAQRERLGERTDATAVVLGLGLGYHLEALAAAWQGSIVVVELDRTLWRTALAARDLRAGDGGDPVLHAAPGRARRGRAGLHAVSRDRRPRRGRGGEARPRARPRAGAARRRGPRRDRPPRCAPRLLVRRGPPAPHLLAERHRGVRLLLCHPAGRLPGGGRAGLGGTGRVPAVCRRPGRAPPARAHGRRARGARRAAGLRRRRLPQPPDRLPPAPRPRAQDLGDRVGGGRPGRGRRTTRRRAHLHRGRGAHLQRHARQPEPPLLDVRRRRRPARRLREPAHLRARRRGCVPAGRPARAPAAAPSPRPGGGHVHRRRRAARPRAPLPGPPRGARLARGRGPLARARRAHLPPPHAAPARDRRGARPRAARVAAARGDGGRRRGARRRHAARGPPAAARAGDALHALRRRAGPAAPHRRSLGPRGDPALPPPVRRALRAGAARMRKILVVNLTRFGDLLQTSPTIVGLRENHPDAELVALVERNFADVARGLPAVDRVWELDLDRLGHMLIGETGDGLRAAYRVVDETVQALRDERFDLALNYSSSKMSAVLLRLIGAPDTRGWTMSADGHRLIAHPWSRLFAASCLTRRQAPVHLVDYYQRVAGVAAGPH